MVEGVCQCKDSQEVIYRGFCVACKALGCDKCKEGKPEECESCVQGSTEVDGKCVCDTADHQINPNGECELCEVEGCSSCAESNSAVCVQCSDCSARVVEGSCKCATGYVMQEGQCVLCPIFGCEECTLEGETATCISCGEGKVEEDGVCQCEVENMELQNMFCQCKEGFRLVGEQCVACQLENCLDCDGSDIEVCLECAGKSELKNGTCEKCEVPGCASCSSENFCKYCIGGWLDPTDKDCVCEHSH